MQAQRADTQTPSSRFVVIEWPHDHEEDIASHAADIQEMLDGAQVGGARVHHALNDDLIAALELAFAEFDAEVGSGTDTERTPLSPAERRLAAATDGGTSQVEPAKVVLAESRLLRDRSGSPWLVKEIWMASEGHTPYVNVEVEAGDALEQRLFKDAAFLKGVMRLLRNAGYEGQPLECADRWLQGESTVVLEPNRDFREWAISQGFRIVR